MAMPDGDNIGPERRKPAPDRRRRPRGGRRDSDLGLRDPDACPEHGRVYSCVINTVKHRGYIYRRHRCLECDYRWNSYQTLIDPLHIRLRSSPDHKML
jgi:hypothetical protein